MKTHPSRPRRARVLPQVEALEQRQVLSCTVTQNAGVMTIIGDNRANTVKITDKGTSAPGAIIVQADGVTTLSTMPIREIRVATLDGTDRVSYALVGSLQPCLVRMVRVNLGGGNDQFTATFANPRTGVGSDILGRAKFQMNVGGAAGDDTMNVDASKDVDVHMGATFGVQLYGGDGIDSLALLYHGEVDGRAGFGAHGDAGNDRLASINATADLGSTGDMALLVRGGVGADQDLRLFVTRPATCALTAVLDGGVDADVDVWSVGGDPAIQTVNVP